MTLNIFNFGKLILLCLIVNRNSIDLVSISTFLKACIVELAAKIKSLFKAFLNSFRGFRDAKLERLRYDCCQVIQAITVACLTVFYYTKVSHFSQPRILISGRRNNRLKARLLMCSIHPPPKMPTHYFWKWTSLTSR